MSDLRHKIKATRQRLDLLEHLMFLLPDLEEEVDGEGVTYLRSSLLPADGPWIVKTLPFCTCCLDAPEVVSCSQTLSAGDTQVEVFAVRHVKLFSRDTDGKFESDSFLWLQALRAANVPQVVISQVASLVRSASEAALSDQNKNPPAAPPAKPRSSSSAGHAA